MVRLDRDWSVNQRDDLRLETLRAELHEQHLGLIRTSRSGWPASILSIYDPSSDLTAISAAGDEFQRLPPELGWVSSFGGRVIKGPHTPHPDFSLHLAVHQACLDRPGDAGQAALSSNTAQFPMWGILERGVDLRVVLDRLGAIRLEPVQRGSSNAHSLAPVLRAVEDSAAAPWAQSKPSVIIWQPGGTLLILGDTLADVVYQAGILESQLG